MLFEKLTRPERSDLEAILERVASKTLLMVRRRGLLDEEPPSDALAGMRLEAVQSGMTGLLSSTCAVTAYVRHWRSRA